MYLFLGGDSCVNEKDVIGIFDLDTTTVSLHTRSFLKNAEKKKRTEYVNMLELPKSFVLTDKKVIIAPSSASTLEKRSGLKGY